jgi:hypothetical protein
MYYTRDRFNYKVAFIFLANNYIGPDAAHIFFGLPFHSILGFLIFAIPLSLFYTYFSRFTIKKTDTHIRLRFEDEGIREVKWRNAYLVTVAGGISHFFIDQFYHFETRMMLWPDFYITHDQMLDWGGAAYHVVDPLMLIGWAIILATIMLSLYVLKKGYKDTFKMFMTVTTLSIVLMILLSINVFGAEREWGGIVHCVIYVFIPLFLLFYVARDVEENPNTTPDFPKIDRNKHITNISFVSCLISVVFLIVGLIGLFSPRIIATPLAESLGEDVNAVATSIQVLGIVISFIAGALLAGSVGLFFRNNTCRYVVIALYSILWIFALPYAVALFLCEKEVKEIFKNRDNE